jgi:hypothetical protein
MRRLDADAARGSPEERSNGRGDRWEEQSGLTAHDQRSLDAIRRQLDAEFGGQEQEAARRELRPLREPRGWRRDRSHRLAWEWVSAAIGGFVVGSAVALCLAVLVTALYLKNADHDGSVRPDSPQVGPQVAHPPSPARASNSAAASAPVPTPRARSESRAAASAAPLAPTAQPAPPSPLPSRPALPDSALGDKSLPRSSVRAAPSLPTRPPRSSWEIAREPTTESSRADESQ